MDAEILKDTDAGSLTINYREVNKETALSQPIIVDKLPSGLKVYAVGGLKSIDPGMTSTLRKGQVAVTITRLKDGNSIEIRPLTENPIVLCDRDADSNKFFIGLKIKR